MGFRFVNAPWLTDEVATANATPTISVPCSSVIPSGAMGYCEINYIVTGAATMAHGRVRIPFRNVSGVLTLLTAIANIAIAGDAGLLTAIVDATSSGTTLQPRVTGIAATNLTTLLDCRYSYD